MSLERLKVGDKVRVLHSDSILVVKKVDYNCPENMEYFCSGGKGSNFWYRRDQLELVEEASKATEAPEPTHKTISIHYQDDTLRTLVFDMDYFNKVINDPAVQFIGGTVQERHLFINKNLIESYEIC